MIKYKRKKNKIEDFYVNSIWTNEKTKELKVIGSLEELKAEITKSVEAGVMSKDFFSEFRLCFLDLFWSKFAFFVKQMKKMKK